MTTPFILTQCQVQVPHQILNPPSHPKLAYTVKVTLLVSGTGNEVAGFHAGLDGWGSLLQTATQLLALPWLWAFL